MKAEYKDILKHSGVYGIGQLLSRMVSVVMIPVQTRFLTPIDYGVLAILDLTLTVFAILVSGGLATALTRYHQEAATPQEAGAVWWTGTTVAVALTSVVLIPALLLRRQLAELTLGAEEPQGAFYIGLVLATLWFTVVSQVPPLYFRVQKWSVLSVTVAFGSLLFNVALNVYFLAFLGWGVSGILAGNLITLVVMTVVRFGMVIKSWGAFRFDRRMALELNRFGGPIIIVLLLATAMHQIDRILLRRFVDLEAVGLYSLAYQMGQGLNSMFLLPFSTIWAVVLYDIAREPNYKETFARIFEYFVYGLLLLLFGVSLFVKPLLAFFATPQYAAAAELVPIICLSFVFFSLDDQFRVPALLAKRTIGLIPGNAAAVAVNISLNLLLLPRYGVIAAAWVSVVTYACFAGVNLYQCRRIERYNYPIGRCTAILVAMVASFVACQYVQRLDAGIIGAFLVPAMVWIVWAFGLIRPVLKRHGWQPLVALQSRVG
jgi:O-antigen/teichoic acid export membrane protein